MPGYAQVVRVMAQEMRDAEIGFALRRLMLRVSRFMHNR